MPDSQEHPVAVADTDAGPRADAFRRALAQLEPLSGDDPAARRGADRLERDLLPRTAAGEQCLVAGIVGPNNSGKSALFNALTGRVLSPSIPTGGATRRLVGAATPELLRRMASEPALARFKLEPATPPVQAALSEADDPRVLLAVEVEDMPPGLMLIDTPDFDSIFRDNRLSSESLLAVADLAVAVVTKHSYQNLEVVEFLRTWLRHGRPWVLVYNEGIDEQVARNHAARLASDVGSQPVAVYWAPYDAELASGAGALLPRALEGGPGLKETLFSLEEAAGLKNRALEASVMALRNDLEEVARNLEAEARNAGYVLEAVETRAAVAGRRIADAAMPLAPFLEAFRLVLDRRVNKVRKKWRGMVRKTWLKIASLPTVFRSKTDHAEKKEANLLSLERQELERAWPSFWEEVARDLGPEGRDPARRRCSAEIAALLDTDLAVKQAPERLEAAAASLKRSRVGLEEFQAECEALVERALDESGNEQLIQTATDFVTVAPLGAAIATAFVTGGLGSDLLVLGGGALSTPAMDLLARLLGKSVSRQALNRWIEIRGTEVARLLAGAALPATGPVLRASVEERSRAAESLRSLEEELA